jgi:hypothetical protein
MKYGYIAAAITLLQNSWKHRFQLFCVMKDLLAFTSFKTI